MMHGTLTIPFTSLMADTILEHGLAWSQANYAKRMPAWEVAFWVGTPAVRRAIAARACYERLVESC